ncbi:MAG: hypothetical protein AAB590_02250 [Patescibacteria group bacterium]
MLEITNKTKRKFSSREIFLFKKIYLYILSSKYDLSLVICTDKISKHNTLAYALTDHEGEILLNPSRAGKYSLTELFTHSCAHLKGFNHNKKMDVFENRVLQYLGGK